VPLQRSHQKNGKCGWVGANLEIFDNSAKHGYVTGNRNRDWGASNRFYPIIRILQLHHVAMNSGYARLLSLNERDGRKLVGDADNQHVLSVGTEPWATQIIVENAFIQAGTHAAHSAVQIQDYIARTQHQAARINILPKRVTLAETETGKSVQQTADQHIRQGCIATVILRRLSACNRTYIWHRQIVCKTTKKAACRQRGDALGRAYGLIRPGGPSRLAPAQQT
jgi:hypothetical protein